ncbi:class I SAM-dependent methyltransferase [Paenibacillus silvisoli]|uniref:class I SAM-dependent methyltransferase n=1 Tax=Paenibacillus silvisoli TaxID=3110539 RepID=UPI002805DF7B|nr:class I SAM-dependent methyltransferase [Paenibacillus silvisoli]
MSKGYPQVGVSVTCRSFEEYVLMFDLEQKDLAACGSMLDIAAGASSFTAEAHGRGLDAYAVDPRYELAPKQLIGDAGEEIAVSTAKLAQLSDRFDFSYYGDLDRHRAGREASLAKFASHYGAAEVRENRYRSGTLPNLPFEDNRFGLVLCSHFLFLYEEQFDYDFHLAAVLDMMRVCKPGGSVRIYPLISLKWEPYAHLEQLLEAVRAEGAEAGCFRSKLPFIPGSELGLFVNV